jgi:hypothetical protein
MMTMKQLRLLEKSALKERQLIEGLTAMAKDIERCETSIVDLQRELADTNAKHQGPRTTQQDIDYLSGLLTCAKKKLIWEKQIISLRKRMPLLLEQMEELLSHPQTAPAENSRAEMLQILQKVQVAMERLSMAGGQSG